MKQRAVLYLTLLGSACGSNAPDATRDDRLDALELRTNALEERNATLEQLLTDATEALGATNATLEALEAHERLIAAEVIDDGLNEDGVSDDLPGLVSQLATSRIDSLGAPELATLTARVVANEATLTALTDHERALAAEVTGQVPVASVLTDFEGQLEESRTDLCVTADVLDQRAYATVSYVDAQDGAERARVDAQGYATNADMIAADAVERQWVLDQNYLTSPDLIGYATQGWVEDQGYATDADLTALGSRVSTIEGDYLQAGDLAPFATDADLAALGSRVSTVEGDYLQAGDLAPYATDADLTALGVRVWTIEGDYLQAGDLVPYATDADLAALGSRVSTIEGDYLQSADLAPYATQSWVEATYAQQAELDDVEATAELTLGDHEGRLAALELDPITATAVAAADEAVVALVQDVTVQVDDIAADYLTSDSLDDVVRIIRSDVTWQVETAADLRDKLSLLDSYHIAVGATVTIAVHDGIYDFSEPLTFHHPDGGRVRVEGNAGDATRVRFNFTHSGGVVIDEGSALGYFGGVWLHGDGTHRGLEVSDSSSLVLGNTKIDAFVEGMLVSGSSFVQGDGTGTLGWLTIDDCSDNGLTVSTSSAAVLGAFKVTHADWISAYVTSGSYLEGTHSEVSDSAANGYLAERGGGADVEFSSSARHVRSGYLAHQTGWIDAHTASDTGSGTGFQVSSGSSLNASHSTATGNSVGYRSTGSGYLYAGASSVSDGTHGYVAEWQGQVNAEGTNVSGIDGTAYIQENHGYIYAVGVTGQVTKDWGNNDTTDFIFGL